MWGVLRRYPVAVSVAIALLVGGAWIWTSRVGPQLADAAAQRAIYDRFKPYPGAQRVSWQAYEHRADGRPTGSYGLEAVYRLPPDATAAGVLDHYRHQLPAGWSEASDQTCADAFARLPAPPAAAPGEPESDGPDPAAFVLQLRESRLTIFTSAADPSAGRIDGMTLTLSRTPTGKYVTFDAPIYSCGVADLDQTAVDFDTP